ncbi:unnamed protein product [Soboliphyme baturini]|uniref:HEPN domain-containing protein n=1 Tax=Soboliphyme baturini TaxID=241478 RepID=A0A183IVQ7_9BILA|nr:unnamed protein product [Soboliphyme baturini]
MDVYFDIASVLRPIFEKVTSLQFSSHKMRTFYQKWLNLEERYGSEEVIDQVRERAAVYLKTLTDAMSTGNEQQLDED